MATDKLVDFDHVTDYISREAAISKILSEPTDAHYPSWYAEKLKQIPAADVRPVIKCKNCRWWTKQEKSLQGRCELGGFYPTGEWFCANGERPNCGADMREVTP